MRNFFLLAIISLAVTGCDRREKPNTPPTTPPQSEHNNDNTAKNVRDRNATSKTPMDQYENESDRTITQKIRQAIRADNSLSTNAQNIKIITRDGVVTLRGPVASSREVDAILRKLDSVQGILEVDNQLETTHKNGK